MTLQLQVPLVAGGQQNLYPAIIGGLEWDVTLPNMYKAATSATGQKPSLLQQLDELGCQTELL